LATIIQAKKTFDLKFALTSLFSSFAVAWVISALIFQLGSIIELK
jgi:Fe2+ transport system protein B